MHGTLDSSLRAEWRMLDALAEIAAEWRALVERALEPNVFYDPAFALAAAPQFGSGVGAVLVWNQAKPARLVGLFPARVARHRYGIPLPVMLGWSHPFAPLGVPLIDRDLPDAVLNAWLDHIDGSADLPKLVMLPLLPTQGPVAQRLDIIASRHNLPSATFDAHARAMLEPGGARNGYLDWAMPHRKRKELGRLRRRLSERGTLMAATAEGGPPLEGALRSFLTLEAEGWKGRAGTAAACDPCVKHFFKTAVRGLAVDGKARIDRLLLDDKAIAATVTLANGDVRWLWKIAYDEALARSSPGVQLALDVTERMLADASVRRVDSCATANHPMIDHIWRERLELADRLIAVRGSARFALACRLEAARRAAIATAKAMRDMMRSHS